MTITRAEAQTAQATADANSKLFDPIAHAVEHEKEPAPMTGSLDDLPEYVGHPPAVRDLRTGLPGVARSLWDRCVECNCILTLDFHRRRGLCTTCGTMPFTCGEGCTPGDHFDGCINARPKHYSCRCLPTPAQLAMPWGDGARLPYALICERAALWSARSDKWHAKLEYERTHVARGVSVPGLVGVLAAAAVGVNALGWLHVPLAGVLPTVAMVIGAVFAWRASTAKVRLEVGRYLDAWVIADRYAEHYRGLLARLDAGADCDVILSESQRLEVAARFGLPESVRSVLDEVTK